MCRLSRFPFPVKGKLIAVFIGLFMAFIWVIVFISIFILQAQFKQILSDQQYVFTPDVAAGREDAFNERTRSLTEAAGIFPIDLGPEKVDAFLSELNTLHALFPAGIAVIGLDGKTIASYPAPFGPGNAYVGERDFFRIVVATRTPCIEQPIMAQRLKRPVVTIAVPVLDAAGNLRAVISGMTDLTANPFLDAVSSLAMAGKGELFVFSPRNHVAVPATNARALAASPARGVNPMHDRFPEGFEGSSVGLDRVPQFISGKYVPIAGWVVVASLATVKLMRDGLYIVAGSMTLAAMLIIPWLVRWMLTPLEQAKQAISEGKPRLSGAGNLIRKGKRSEQELLQSRQLLRDLSAHMESVREEERKRIAREVHDDLGQALTVLRMDVSLLRLNFGGQSPQLMARIHSMTEAVDSTIRIMRDVTSKLRPVALDLGLVAGLEWLVQEFISHAGVPCQLQTRGCEEVVLDDGRATALFRIVQESLTNVAKHAGASEVGILLELKDDESVCIEIGDDGKGFIPDGTRKAGSFGLIGMRERALMLSGTVDIHSVPGHGTRIEVRIPLILQ